VHDEGLGFDSNAAERIFDRFHRLDPQQTQGIGGTGLGLYISKELVQRMGGRIWAEAERGEGASFFFELPLARDSARATQGQRGPAG
jgi:signal transduction histidine kinase